MSDQKTAYLATSGYGDDYSVERIYLDRDDAEAYVAARNAAGGFFEVEEQEIGAPNVAYDGPIWSVTWSARRKQKGERQLVLVAADGFATVVPSAVPTPGGLGYSYREYFAGPHWADLAAPIEYEEPPVWIDAFYSHQDWVSGDNPGEAALTFRGRESATARGTSKQACEALVRATALEVKGELGMA